MGEDPGPSNPGNDTSLRGPSVTEAMHPALRSSEATAPHQQRPERIAERSSLSGCPMEPGLADFARSDSVKRLSFRKAVLLDVL